MGVYYFTDEQLEELKKNPYVKNVTLKAVTYSEEFKTLFWNDYQNGLNPSHIFKKYGFDIQALGEKRIGSFTQRIKNQANRLQGFKDTRKENSGRPSTKDLTDEEKIKQLNHKIDILKQENDFLKRIDYINRKHLSKKLKAKQQKKNTK